MDALKVTPCDPMKNNKFHNNWYLKKISNTSSELKGNITIETIPFDDNLNVSYGLKVKL